MPKVKFFTSLSVLIFKFTKGVPMKAEDKGCVTQEPRKEVLLRSSVIFLDCLKCLRHCAKYLYVLIYLIFTYSDTGRIIFSCNMKIKTQRG